jgi:hypothetical protein
MMRALVLGLGIAAAACADRDRLAGELRAAAAAERMPKVVACWEKSFEAASFRGAYVAVVDFQVEAETGRVHETQVRAVRAVAEGGLGQAGAEGGALGACLEAALEATHLAHDGWRPAHDLTVTGFSLAFVDASAEARREAKESTPHVLIGPRADRCQGLYAYEPPRDTAALVAELDAAELEAERSRSSDADRHARALQRAYDVALELSARLELESGRNDLPAASRQRTLEARDRTARTARQLGARIGCRP